MNRLRDGAILLGLAGMVLMAAADTKDVNAKISYESRTVQETEPELLPAESRETGVAELLPAESRETRGAEPETEEGAGLELAQEQDSEASSGWLYELSKEEYDALLRLVEAEASGEDSRGKQLVANVVLNRVKDSGFPDTVKEVIYQRENGRAQFAPVASGKLEQITVSGETVEAVERALCGEDESEGALYFVAPAHAGAESYSWFRRNLTLLFSYQGHEFYA